MRASTFAFVTLLTGWAIAGPPAKAQENWHLYPEWNGEVDRIVYYERDGDYARIVSVNPDGSDRMELTDGTHYDANPSWSSDGTQIVFTRAKGGIDGPWDVYLMDADGSNVEILVDTEAREMHPAWSPGGGLVAFLRAQGRSTDIYSINIASGLERRLTNTPELELHPSWGPLGKVIAFDVTDSTGVAKVCLLNMINRAAECPLALGETTTRTPAISPENGRIVFSMVEGGQSDLWLFDIQEGSLDQITATLDQNEAAPSWSPDRQRIVFHSDPDGVNHLFVMNVDKSGRVQITE